MYLFMDFHTFDDDFETDTDNISNTSLTYTQIHSHTLKYTHIHLNTLKYTLMQS
jgi:hypothetical protein